MNASEAASIANKFNRENQVNRFLNAIHKAASEGKYDIRFHPSVDEGDKAQKLLKGLGYDVKWYPAGFAGPAASVREATLDVSWYPTQSNHSVL